MDVPMPDVYGCAGCGAVSPAQVAPDLIVVGSDGGGLGAFCSDQCSAGLNLARAVALRQASYRYGGPYRVVVVDGERFPKPEKEPDLVRIAAAIA